MGSAMVGISSEGYTAKVLGFVAFVYDTTIGETTVSCGRTVWWWDRGEGVLPSCGIGGAGGGYQSESTFYRFRSYHPTKVSGTTTAGGGGGGD